MSAIVSRLAADTKTFQFSLTAWSLAVDKAHHEICSICDYYLINGDTYPLSQMIATNRGGLGQKISPGNSTGRPNQLGTASQLSTGGLVNCPTGPPGKLPVFPMASPPLATKNISSFELFWIICLSFFGKKDVRSIITQEKTHVYKVKAIEFTIQ